MKYRPKTRFYRHQKRGLEFLWRNKGGAAFWSPGTGKTKLALDFAASLHMAGKVNRVLVLCTINALQVWPAQAEDHCPVPFVVHVPEGKIAEKAAYINGFNLIGIKPDNLQIIVLNYDAVIQRDKEWAIMRAIEAWKPDLLVLDESQKVKRATTKRAKAAHRLGGVSQYVLLLTGTPLAKNWLDLYSQLKVINPNIWYDERLKRPMSWTRFRETYAIWGGRSGYELVRYQNLDDLKRRYSPICISVPKELALDLPRTSDVIIPVKMNPQARKSYDMFAKEGLIVWKRHLIEAPIVLTKLLRLQQMAGGAVHDEMGELVEFQNDKMAVALDLLEGLKESGEKHLVFARFKWEMDALSSGVETDLVIRGGVSSKVRKLIVGKFIESDEPETLIIQIGSGEALDGLQHVCSNAVFYSTDYSWENFGQSRGRIERSGQKKPITFWHIHCQATVDKLVYRALKDKRDIEQEVMHDPDLLIVGDGI